jgi:hypothetical protein
MSDHLEPQPAPEPVPFPTPYGPRMAGVLPPEPNGHALRPQTEQPPPQPARLDEPVVADAQEVIERLKRLQIGANAGLFEMTVFFAEIIGNYQQRYFEATGQAIPFREAVGQIFATISLIAD